MEYGITVLEMINVLLSSTILMDDKLRDGFNIRFPTPELFIVPTFVFHDTPEFVVE